jgi:hypothetical protein
MEAKANIYQMAYDNIQKIKKAIDNNELMQVMVTDFDGESFTEKGHGEIEPLIGLWIQDYSEKGCTLMVNITKKEALFLAKSLLAIAESV